MPVESGEQPLFVRGHELRLFSACPVLNPNAAIQIEDDLIQVYQESIDALINQLGKNVLLEFDPIQSPCPNCEFDAAAGRSKGIYKPGGPIPFARGQKCPHCKGQGFTSQANILCIKCLLKWAPKDFGVYGVSVADPKGLVRTKGLMTDAAAIARAKTAVVNYDIASVVQLRVRRIRGPYPVGLRQDRYCVAFWELIDG